MIKEFELTLDTHLLSNKLHKSEIIISESDINSIQFNMTIQENGSILNLTDNTLRIGIRKPSDLTISQPCTVTDAVNGKCEVILLASSYDERGEYEAEVYIDSLGGSTLVTNRFNFHVQSSIL